MKLDEIMSKLAELGTEQTKLTFLSTRCASATLYGVRIGDLKKLVKFVEEGSRASAGAIQYGE